MRLRFIICMLAFSSCQARELPFTEKRSSDELSVFKDGKLVYYRLNDNVERFYISGVLLATKTKDGFFTTDQFSGRLNYAFPKPHRPAHIRLNYKGAFQTFEQTDGAYYYPVVEGTGGADVLVIDIEKDRYYEKGERTIPSR